MYLNNLEWHKALKEEFNKDYFKELETKITADQKKGELILPFPSGSLVYRAFELTPLSRVKVVILGQDPYPSVQNATGLAFSVPGHKEAPASLRNIFKELKSDLGINNKFNDLSYWAVQGVLLLNTILTVNAGQSNSHKNYGWEVFTDKVLEIICKNRNNMIFLLMGKEAQSKRELIKGDHIIIETAHPSPLSAHRGFFWSKPFSRINNALIKYNKLPVNWQT